MTVPGPVEVAAFEAANSRAYLSAVFAAWAEGQTVMALPEGAGRRTVPGTIVRSRDSFAPDPGWFEADLPARAPEERALIAFSSGTTGRPKAILLQHRALGDVVGRINTAMGVDDTIREYLGVPVTYSFGFGRARAIAAAGGRAFLPEHGFDPAEIGRMLASGEINAVSAVPTLWRVLLANSGSVSAESARNLRWIEIGSQWMTGAEKLALRQMFPNAKILQHYGLTEASRSALLDISEAPEDRLESVGQATGETAIEIDGEGRIRVRGPHLAEGLVSGAGVKPVADADGWLTTSDRGRIENGWLYYDGRVDELINAGGLKIDPTAFETAVNTALGVPGAVAAGRIADDLRGEKVLVALRQDAGLDRETVTRAVRSEAERLGLTGNGSFELRQVADLPLTATGKVRRADLPTLEEVGTAPQAATTASSKAGPSKAAGLQGLWGEILGLETVPTDKSFYDLGGDSLSALTAILKMETLGIDTETARGIFEGKTIAQMAGEEASAKAPSPVAAAQTAPETIPAAPTGKTAELQTLWGEILGLDTVPTDKSFYDLGGDSLSALTAILKMETLGIDAATARGIFEGKTIDQMAGAAPEPASASETGTETGTDAIPTEYRRETDVAEPAVPAPPATGKAAELQALWGEILGLDNVPTDKSFYDLGGDSLSALTAILKMEALGIDTETARGIFEGKTIRDMAGTEVTATPAATGGKMGELQTLWGEILGLETVPTDKSFYDLGGDSLSALTAILKMEALGIDAETARGIFEGRTVRDMAGAAAPETAPFPASVPTPAPAAPAAPAPQPTGPTLTLAETVNAVHATRGVLVLWVVLVHWLPALLVRLGENTLWIYDALVPAWRFGTPGFAMVFGMGVGALGFYHYQSNRALFLKSTRFNTRLIVGGVLILAAVKFLIVLVEGKLGDRLAMSGLLYSAITYYALAMLTLPLIMRLLTIGRNRILTILAIAAGSMLIHEILRATIADLQPPAAIEFLKITFSAKYGYFRMTSFVMIGVAIGWLFRQYHTAPDILRELVAFGLVAITFGAVGVWQASPEAPFEGFGLIRLWHLMIYAGIALLILAGFAWLNRAGGQHGKLMNWLNAFAIASGILALPIFVGHEVLLSLKHLLDSFGVPDLVGLAVLLGGFFVAMWIAYAKLMRFLIR